MLLVSSFRETCVLKRAVSTQSWKMVFAFGCASEKAGTGHELIWLKLYTTASPKGLFFFDTKVPRCYFGLTFLSSVDYIVFIAFIFIDNEILHFEKIFKCVLWQLSYSLKYGQLSSAVLLEKKTPFQYPSFAKSSWGRGGAS